MLYVCYVLGDVSCAVLGVVRVLGCVRLLGAGYWVLAALCVLGAVRVLAAGSCSGCVLYVAPGVCNTPVAHSQSFNTGDKFLGSST